MVKSKVGGVSHGRCGTGVFGSKGNIPSVCSYSSVVSWLAEVSLLPSKGRSKLPRISRHLYMSTATVGAFLGALIFLANVAGAIQPPSPTVGVETRSMVWSTIADDNWLNEGFPEAQPGIGSGAALSAPPVKDIRPLRADGVFRISEEPNGALHTGNQIKTEGVDTPFPAAPPAGNQAREPVIRLSRSTAALLLLFMVGLPVLNFLGPSIFLKKSPDVRPERFDEQLRQGEGERKIPQQREEEDAEPPRQQPQRALDLDTCKVGLQQLDDMQKLQPLTAHLAKMVGTGEALSAMHDFGQKVKRGNHIRQTLLAGSIEPGVAPGTLVSGAVSDGLLALSRLYEVAREHGLSLAQKVRSINPPPVLSEEELNATRVCLPADLSGLLEFYLRDAHESFLAHMRIVETVEKRLEGLRGIEGANDWHVVATVAAGLEFIKESRNVAEREAKIFEHVKQSADALMQMHHLRRQEEIHRKLADEAEKLRVLNSIDRWRKKKDSAGEHHLPVHAKVDSQIGEVEQLLERHQEELNKMEKAEDHSSAQSAKQAAEDLVRRLKALLSDVANLTLSMPPIGEDDAGDHESKVLMEALSLRAKLAAEKALERVKGIQKELESQSLLRSGDASLELDMRQSMDWARSASAAVRIEAEMHEMPEHWFLSLSFQRTKKFQSLLEQMRIAKKDARLRVKLKDLAVAAGAMRQASLGLVSIVQGQDGTNLIPRTYE
ncbi:uncharacterized protein EMH_0012290 [Eimeria mitis]|uniref:Transmembrane protein n=1 Tax=Eimeria mitis TaxID=44415 RepID=U6K3T5_9EIME|nr:uncharacterized protein EMH_0012290 [Eimeria mitis]CDJ32380.1 hypothetical protein, conserved [Eimeria mitis]